jgi:hypothetical protein
MLVGWEVGGRRWEVVGRRWGVLWYAVGEVRVVYYKI